jgi:hypothetical protein
MRFDHPRSSWVSPAPPITGPRIDWSLVDTVVIHYTAADDLIDGDPGEHAEQLDEYLRAMQRSYVASRGYSVGYNAAVDYRSHSWELRGADIKCAANRGHNDHTFAILVLVDGADPANAAMIAKIRGLVAEAEELAGRKLAIIGHGQLAGAATACPGAGLRQQIAQGVFAPSLPPPIEIPSEDDMTALSAPVTVHDTRKDPAGVLQAGEVRRIPVWITPVEAAVLKLTVIGPPNDGYLAVSAETPPPDVASVAFNGGPPARVTSVGVTTKVVDQHVYVRSTQPCHLVIAVEAVR